MRMPRPRFTIRRMMVALALLALPLWLLTIREEVDHRVRCSSNISQIAMALDMYQLRNRHFPAGTRPRAGRPPSARLAWTIDVLPYIDQLNLYKILSTDPSAVPASRLRIFECPSNPTSVSTGGHGLNHFVGIAGLGIDAPTLPTSDPRAGIFGYDRTTHPAEIRDGSGTTMMLAETGAANGPWHHGGPSTVRGLDPARRPYIGIGRQFGGTHRGGANVAMADGSVKFIRETIDPRVFEAMSTIAGGEAVPAGWDK